MVVMGKGRGQKLENTGGRHLWKALYSLHHHLNSKYSHVNKQFVFVLYVLRLLACFALEIQCIKQLGLG